MISSLFDEGAFALARLALKDAREAIANADVGSATTRKSAVARLATPWFRDLVKKEGTRYLAAIARPRLASISRHLRQTICELRHAD